MFNWTAVLCTPIKGSSIASLAGFHFGWLGFILAVLGSPKL